MAESRLKSSLINSIAGVGSQLLITVLNFISRTAFIHILGSEYLGINGLFSNILSMLSLSEMGIGTAIVFNMYRAVQANDKDQINRLISFYAKVYTAIGFIIMGCGFGCSFFIQYLIKENSFALPFLRISFLLLVFNNAVSYFWSYRSCILFAYQKDYICKIVSSIISVCGILLQIATLIFTENYIAYLCVQVVVTVLNNCGQFYISKKMYPWVKVCYRSRLPQKTFADIVNRVKALLIHSISGALNFGTDNIIISKFVGILETGLYSNYSMLINTLNGLVTQLLNGVTASMGNLMASEDREKIYGVFKKIDFLCQWIYGTLTIGMVGVIDQFIDLWTGSGHLLNRGTVLILVFNFYVLGARQAIMITRNAGGFYVNDRIIAVIKPLINLTLSIILVKKIGITGVFIGTAVSQIVADIILFPLFLFKNVFEEKIKFYYFQYCKSIIIVLVSGILCMMVTASLENFFNGWILFVLSGTCSVLIYNLLYLGLNSITPEFKFFMGLFILKKCKKYHKR